MEQPKKAIYADDATEGIPLLLELRLPWLILGLLGGILASYFVSLYESVLSQNISLAFFLPLIVYMSSAVGTQTETIYIRNLNKKGTTFRSYVVKEFILGVVLGAVFGSAIWFIAQTWFTTPDVARTVGLAMFINLTTAPLVALSTAALLKKGHEDPALGAGPLTTVLQDIISLLIYLAIASAILF